MLQSHICMPLVKSLFSLLNMQEALSKHKHKHGSHRAAVYLHPNWTCEKSSSSSSESSSLLPWDTSERAWNRKDRGLAWPGEERRSEGWVGSKDGEEVVCARVRKRGQTGRKIGRHDQVSGRGRTGMRAHEEKKLEDCMRASSSLPKRLFLNIH